MVDRISPDNRSRLMSRIRSRDTGPELTVRRIVHRMGYRFRVNRPDLPARPDLVFPSRRKVIFVHGCFWHWHSDPNCRDGHIPNSRRSYWVPKLAATRERDSRKQAELEALGWTSLVIWECEIRNSEQINSTIRMFLDDPARKPKGREESTKC